MHDETLERRLRSTLRDEAHAVAFTITAAELERRAALRSRGRGNRRIALLLAATVGIGLIGVGGALNGLITFIPGPSPTPDATEPDATETAPLPSSPPPGPVALPDLDELLADIPADSVVIAQAHGPASGPETRPEGEDLGAMTVLLGDLRGSGDFEVTFACLGEGELTIDLAVPQGDRYLFVARETCDGALHRETVSGNGPDGVYLLAEDPASWRVVVRRLDGVPVDTLEPPVIEIGAGEEQLIVWHDRTIQPDNASPAAVSGLMLEEIGVVPARLGYVLRVQCLGGDAIRYIHGDFVDGEFAPTTTTVVDCDNRVHEVFLSIPEPEGSRVFVAAEPETRWSILTSSEQPPVAIVRQQPGWQLSSGAGPDLSFSTSEMAFTGFGVEGGGEVLIAVACAGRSTTIEVIVDVGAISGEREERFVAPCDQGGAVTSQSFATEASYVTVTYPTPAGRWTAVSILVPDPSTAP